MKILAVADEESKYLWEYYEPSKLRDIDLIIGCGDLSRHYMNFLSDAAPVPVLYVHGNHDASYDREPPRGAICIDDDLYWYKGYRIVGLGGNGFTMQMFIAGAFATALPGIVLQLVLIPVVMVGLEHAGVLRDTV